MQDSLDDYLNLSLNINSSKPTIGTKKELNITTKIKKECDARALKIVEFSVEGRLRPEVFTKCLPFINQSQYQDIVEERAITKLCGYSMCGKRIPEMPKKQYYISTKNNKVYDITDRKNYCSNFCYKASLHIKKQIDNSPLWLRKLDDIPKYQLLASEESGLPGECIDQGITKPLIEPSFTSISNFTAASLSDMIEKEKGKLIVEKKIKSRENQKKLKLVKTLQTITENTEQTEEELEVIKPVTEHKEIQNSATVPVIIENEDNYEYKYESYENLNISQVSSKKESRKVRKKSGKLNMINIEETLRKCIREWISLESLIFLYGESKIKEILNERKLSDCFEKLNIAKLQMEQQVKYMDICKRLHLQEMADEKFDNAVIGDSLKPLPDFTKRKQESKELNLKVRCFYSGVLHKKDDGNFPTKINKSEEKGKGKEDADIPAVLPLIDVNSQKALRRKIFLNAVNKSMQQLLQTLRVKCYSTVLSELQTLVKTFNLSADNIVFKPALWNYISVLLLNILGIQNSNIKNVLEDKASLKYIKLHFFILPKREEIITEIMKEICDIDNFIENYILAN